MGMAVKRLSFVKYAARSLQAAKVCAGMVKLHQRVLSGARAYRGWNCRINDIQHDELETPIRMMVTEKDPETKESKEVEREFGHQYICDLDIVCAPKRGRKDEVVTKELEQIIKVLTTSAGTKGWELVNQQDMPEDYKMPGVKYREPKEEVEEVVTE